MNKLIGCFFSMISWFSFIYEQSSSLMKGATWALLCLLSLYLVNVILILNKDGNLPWQQKTPYLGVHATNNILDDSMRQTPGEIIYSLNLERSSAETTTISNLFLEIVFPVPIKSFTCEGVGYKNLRVHFGKKTYFFEGQTYSYSLIVEVDEFMPRGLLDLQARSISRDNRLGTEHVDCKGYYYYEVANNQLRKYLNLSLDFSAKRMMPFNVEKWNLLQDIIHNITPRTGTLALSVADPYWLERNNYVIDFIPKIANEDFYLRIFRDKDNIFKCELKNLKFPKVILKTADLEAIKKGQHHPTHVIVITWEQKEKKLYIDGQLVDSSA